MLVSIYIYNSLILLILLWVRKPILSFLVSYLPILSYFYSPRICCKIGSSRCLGRPGRPCILMVKKPNRNPSFLTSIPHPLKRTYWIPSFNPQNLCNKSAKWSKWHQQELNNFSGWTFGRPNLGNHLLFWSWDASYPPFAPFGPPNKSTPKHTESYIKITKNAHLPICPHRSLMDRLGSLRASAPQAMTWQQRPCWGRSKGKKNPNPFGHTPN